MKRILIACGNGIATSTVVATKVKEYLTSQGVQVWGFSAYHQELTMGTANINGSH